jgi:hypothetical protein
MEYITYVVPSSTSTNLTFCTSGVQWTIDDTFGSFYDQKEIFSNHHLITYFCSLINFEKSKKEFQKVLDYSKFDDLPILRKHLFAYHLVIFTKADLFKMKEELKDRSLFDDKIYSLQKEIEMMSKGRRLIFWVPDDLRNQNEMKNFLESKLSEILALSSFDKKLNFLTIPNELTFPYNIETFALNDLLYSLHSVSSNTKAPKKRSSSFFSQSSSGSDLNSSSKKKVLKDSTPVTSTGAELMNFLSTQSIKAMDTKEATSFLQMLIEIGFLFHSEKDVAFNESITYTFGVDGLKSYLAFDGAILIETMVKFQEWKILKFGLNKNLKNFHNVFLNGLEIKNRTHKFKKYNDSFIASDAIKWMIESLNISRDVSESFGNFLCSEEFFISNGVFSDSMLFVKLIAENNLNEKIEKLEK